MPMRELSLADRLAFRFFEVARTSGLNLSNYRSRRRRRMRIGDARRHLAKRFGEFLEGGFVKLPRPEDGDQLTLIKAPKRIGQPFCRSVRRMRRRDYPRTIPNKEMLSGAFIDSLTLRFACFMTKEGCGEVRYAECLNELRGIVVRQVLALGYKLDEKAKNKMPNWPSSNHSCSWACLARVDGAHQEIVEISVRAARKAS